MPVRTEAAMGTVVSVRVLREGGAAERAVERAFGWFREAEARCTRFDSESELMRLCGETGRAVTVSAVLFEAVRFAVQVAERSGGAFDPTVGRSMEARGFDRNYRTGAAVASGAAAEGASWRDIEMDAEKRTIRLRRAMTLDLGAVAKGLAVDAAARELAEFRDFAIDAGGDLYLGGRNERGEAWRVGIRNPLRPGELIARVAVSDGAVCTSGGYERPVAGAAGEHHIVDPRNGRSPREVASATVMAPHAMLADALATAAFVMGPEAGIALLEGAAVQGLIVTPELDEYRTRKLGDAA
jgi:thiamine biosynthesis lipoprotein